jgi:hypothetical protein
MLLSFVFWIHPPPPPPPAYVGNGKASQERSKTKAEIREVAMKTMMAEKGQGGRVGGGISNDS